MLTVNLRHLEAHEIHLQGELPVTALDLDVRDPMVRPGPPLRYDLTVAKLPGSVLVTGSLQLTLDCDCVRCLKPFRQEIRLPHWTCHLPLDGEERVRVDNDCVDLTPHVREDILLEFPQHPLCRPECGGLEKISSDKPRAGSSAWTQLDKLKL